MYLNHAAELAYLAHPRTASHSTSTALMTQAGFETKDRAEHHFPLPDGLAHWHRILTVRNPFDAAVSLWHHWNRPVPFGQPFVEWCFAHHPNLFPVENLWFGLHLPAGPPNGYVHVVRYEMLEQDLNARLKRFGLGPVTLAREHVGVRRNGSAYQRFWDKRSIVWMRERFGEELRRLNYDYEKLR